MILKENLFEFRKGMDPVDSLGMGRRQMIKDWLDSMKIIKYVINDDYTIDVDGFVRLQRLKLINFPYFIQFGKIDSDFYIYDNEFTTLRGCPRIVKGAFSCRQNKLKSLEGCPEIVDGDFYCWGNLNKFTKKDVIKVCKVGGVINNGFTY